MNKIKIEMPVIVEGKYDMIKLNSIIDGVIIKTDGFSIFNSEDNRNYIKQLANTHGVIILTDSDDAGLVIRNHLSSFLPKDKIFHLYPPQIKGKEKRKITQSKAGYLGVEGISQHTLKQLLAPFECENKKKNKCSKKITKLDFFEDGLTGGKNSNKKRSWLKKRLGLPDNISSNALLDAINLLYSYDEYKLIIKESENCHDNQN